MPDPRVRSVALVSVVDDDASVRRALRRLIQQAGFEVQTFASGAEALAENPARPAACLVVDVYLGDMTGFELQRVLAERGVNVPTIFITAHDDAATTEAARRARVFAYLHKPIDGDSLLGAISDAVATHPN
ncbi:MAG TPA: response regulator [Methylomirabilota bacterium]|nr:response regulator [Methylomirabilota bacterium]